MPLTGAIIAGAGASTDGIGTVAWSDTGNITASDDSDASSAVQANISKWLAATDFDFSAVPANALILGLTGTVEASRGPTATASLTAATLIVGDAPVGTTLVLATALSTSDVAYTINLTPLLNHFNLTSTHLKTATTGWAISATGGGGTASVTVDAMWLEAEWLEAGAWSMQRRVAKLARIRRREEDERYAVTMRGG